ncbi:MAG: hypothetical protein ACXQTG_04030 [Methanoculleaceae archaeon]
MRQDRLFIPVTMPPIMERSTSAGPASNARALSDWLDGVLSNEDAVAVVNMYLSRVMVIIRTGTRTRPGGMSQRHTGWERWIASS